MVKKSASSEELAVEPSSPAPRPSKKDAIAIPQSDDLGWGVLERKIGGREGLLEASQLSSNPKAAILAELLLDPAFAKHGTKALARKAGFTAAEVVDLYRDKKLMESMLVIHDRLPSIVEGAASDAAPTMEPCAECKATGLVDGKDCWVCGGLKAVRRAGDSKKLDFIGEVVGISGQKGPLVQTNIQVNNQSQTIATSFEDMVRRAVPKKQDLIEGEIVDEEPAT